MSYERLVVRQYERLGENFVPKCFQAEDASFYDPFKKRLIKGKFSFGVQSASEFRRNWQLNMPLNYRKDVDGHTQKLKIIQI